MTALSGTLPHFSSWAVLTLCALALSACAGKEPPARPETAELLARLWDDRPSNTAPIQAPDSPPRAGRSSQPSPVIRAGQSVEPQTVRRVGNGLFMAPSSDDDELDDGIVDSVSLSFRDAAVEDVVAAVLGDLLGQNYIIDPAVSGLVTLQTSQPLPRSALLDALDNALRVNGATLVRRSDFFEIRPAGNGAQGHLAPLGVGRRAALGAGHGTHIVPLRYVGAQALRDVLDPMKPSGASVQADPTRNILILSGGSAERARLIELIDAFDVDWMAGMSFVLQPLRSASPETMVQELEAVFGAGADAMSGDLVRFVPVNRLNAILVVSKSPGYLRRVEDWITTFDRGGQGDGREVSVYSVRHGRAKDLAITLGGIYDAGQQTLSVGTTAPGQDTVSLTANAGGGQGVGQGGGVPPSSISRRVDTQDANRDKLIVSNDFMRIIADEQQNSLTILARPADHERVLATLREIDTPPRQVLIEATIAEVQLNDELRFGLQWFFQSGNFTGSFTDPSNGAVSSIVQSAGDLATGTPVSAGLFPGSQAGANVLFQGADAIAVLDALDAITDVQVVSSPQVAVLNNESAVLQVGDQVPITTQAAVSVIDNNAPVVNNVEYRDTGVILVVTPEVKAEHVVLHVEQEVSSVVETTTSGIDSPTIQQRRIESRVAARDGQTVALGGLIRRAFSDSRTGLPILSRLPVLGPLFGATSRRAERTELLVMIRATIIRNDADYQAATDDLRSQLTIMRDLLNP